MIQITNYEKYCWDDLKSFAIIANKAYNNDLNSLVYFKNIEKNLKIKGLMTNNTENNNVILDIVSNNEEIIKLEQKPIKEKEKEKEVIYYKNDCTDAEFYSFEYNNTLIYSFTGTNSVKDWEHDLNISLEKIFIGGKFCKIHKGFYEQYYSLRSKILDIYREYTYKYKENSKVVIIAHSLGTIGQISSIEMKEIYNNANIDCITFGAPCIGNNDYVNICNKCINNNIRIVNDNDIIPSLPLSNDFKQGGKILLLKNNKVIYKDRNIWTNLKIYFLVIFSWIPFLKIDVITDHKTENYINEISKLNIYKGI